MGNPVTIIKLKKVRNNWRMKDQVKWELLYPPPILYTDKRKQSTDANRTLQETKICYQSNCWTKI
jgi:hypothetical protein